MPNMAFSFNQYVLPKCPPGMRSCSLTLNPKQMDYMKTIKLNSKNLLNIIDSAIAKANIGVNPNNDGSVIKLFFPPMTIEQRQESVKQMKVFGENAKVAVRNIRRDANDALKKLIKDKEISEDDERRSQDEIQKITDKNVAEIDKMLQAKEADLMAV
jgi:ribosome recycling factor